MRALLVCLAIVALGLVGCEPTLSPHAEHVLNRIGYGADPWSRERIQRLGVTAYVEEQLHPERIDDSLLESRLRSRYPATAMSLAQLYSAYRNPKGEPWEVRDQLGRAKVMRAVFSRRQLEQVLVDFWFDHFNVDARRQVARWAVVPFERDVIRPRVLGRFENLLLAVARHPAMLEYLDNASNFREGTRVGVVPYGVNENFARELLELHTVGPDAGRRLRDIHQTALAFTGWTVTDPPLGFTFYADGHDRSEKTVLGLTLPAGRGIEDGEDLIRYLARHPDTAAHLARKLCARFVAETSTDCEARATARYLATQGDLRAVVREVLSCDAFHDRRYYRAKVKRPLHVLASLARALGVKDEALFAYEALDEIRKLGEDPYGAGPPDGWPDASAAWRGEGPFLRRISAYDRAVRGAFGLRPPSSLGTQQTVPVFDGVVDRVLPSGTGAGTRLAILDFLVDRSPSVRLEEATILLLASPEFAHH